jgi:pimeloyl-ACP methyl ester carboxylesterase
MRLQANGTAIEIDDQGPPSGEPLLLIMGLGMQLIAWPDEFVQRLVARGFRVVRFDNRDVGLSQGFDALGVPNLAWVALRYLLRLPVHAPYRLHDMAADTVGVLDALGLERAHVCGASLGGMIAQHVAAGHPERVRSLTLMMTSSGARHLPQASLQVRRALLERDGRNGGFDARVARLMRLFALIGSPAYRPDPEALRRRLEASLQRAYRPAGIARQLAAAVADGDRTPLLGRITAPTHILHGSADPLVPPQAAHDLHAKIRGSSLEIVEGMGHDLPAPLLPRFVQSIGALAERARAGR